MSATVMNRRLQRAIADDPKLASAQVTAEVDAAGYLSLSVAGEPAATVLWDDGTFIMVPAAEPHQPIEMETLAEALVAVRRLLAPE